jgi:hypothetical protein
MNGQEVVCISGLKCLKAVNGLNQLDEYEFGRLNSFREVETGVTVMWMWGTDRFLQGFHPHLRVI